MDYESMKQLASDHGFASFTALQEDAFSNPEFYSGRDLFIIGQTSTGKTLIPVLLYAQDLQEAEEAGMPNPKMLFVVPYRALAAQKVQELRRFFQRQHLQIVQSTGEYRQDDADIQRAQVDIAVIITEKAFKYQARDEEFFSRYDDLVLDEVGLVDNADRGIRLDFVFAWAFNSRKLYGRPRTVALATPFYDWCAYLKSYGFLTICRDDRPVKLKETVIVYNRQSILEAEGCDFLQSIRMVTARRMEQLRQKYDTRAYLQCGVTQENCLLREPARTDRSVDCPFRSGPCMERLEYVPEGCGTGKQYILLKLCQEHLNRGHQILIFINDREQVKNLCRFLYQQLRDLLPEPPEAERCKQEILADCGLEAEDVYGVLEYGENDALDMELYRALKAGVGFHSAELPNELRTYVEERFLDRRELKIVCSTETLAFGVNSAVDVVILADQKKQEGGESRFLTMNELRNYEGRAGRMKPGLNAEDAICCVYVLLPQASKSQWEAIRRDEPNQLHSRLHSDDGQYLPFFLLNMLPDNDSDGMTVQEMVQLLATLPQDGSATEKQLKSKVTEALEFLCNQELATISRVRAMGRFASDRQSRCCLTAGKGSRLRGYSIGKDDYILLVHALDEYINGIFGVPDDITFLYRLLQTRHAVQGLNNAYSRSETRMNMEELRTAIRSWADQRNDLSWLNRCRDERILSILAAILAWRHGESPKSLYRQYGIHYALLEKLTDQIGCLIEIAVEILPFHMEKIWAHNAGVYSRFMPLNVDSLMEQEQEKKEKLHDLFVSVYFGINTYIAREYLDFLLLKQEPEAQDMARELSLESLDPKAARKLRKLAVRYLFFAHAQEADLSDSGARHNYSNQRWHYQQDVKNMGPYAEAFFQARFPGFSD